MRLKIYHIDAFANTVFKGNYAAVIVTDQWLPNDLMQSIATENPVTGSIHAGLAPLWAERLGENTLTAYQASKRGGILKVIVIDKQVIVSGKAVQCLEGYINV